MNQACFNLTKCILILFLIVQLLLFLYMIAKSGLRLILMRQDDVFSVDDKRNINFNKYLLIQITIMQIVHTIFFIYVLIKDKTIGIILMIICTLIQLIAKLTIKKAFVHEELFITLFVLDFINLFFALTLIPKQSKGFKFKMIFKNSFFA